VEFLQLTAPDQGSKEDIADNAPYPLSIVDLFNDDVGDMSKVPTCDIKGLNIELTEQDYTQQDCPDMTKRSTSRHTKGFKW
jgi:hypothetical protein